MRMTRVSPDANKVPEDCSHSSTIDVPTKTVRNGGEYNYLLGYQHDTI